MTGPALLHLPNRVRGTSHASHAANDSIATTLATLVTTTLYRHDINSIHVLLHLISPILLNPPSKAEKCASFDRSTTFVTETLKQDDSELHSTHPDHCQFKRSRGSGKLTIAHLCIHYRRNKRDRRVSCQKTPGGEAHISSTYQSLIRDQRPPDILNNVYNRALSNCASYKCYDSSRKPPTASHAGIQRTPLPCFS